MTIQDISRIITATCLHAFAIIFIVGCGSKPAPPRKVIDRGSGELTIHADGNELKVTISIGWVSLVPSDTVTQRDLIAGADKALYQAKSNGRNQVCPMLEQAQ